MSAEESAVVLTPVVGIGASAGGLGPTVEILRAFGEAPGVALVVVHHLDPTHSSSLVEILGRATTLPVSVVTDGVRVERDHVYVIPPNAGVLIDSGVLRLTPRSDRRGIPLPIDQFFESLAEDQSVHPFAVVLSGTGYDGTLGIKAVKAAGGITFVQDATAQHGGMPASATATGCVDFVLPPDEIAHEIRRLSAAPVATGAAEEARAFSAILSALGKTTGIDFASYKESTVRRRILRRAFLQRLRDVREYADYVRQNPAEIPLLSDEMLIHVTSFFRDPTVFEEIKASVLPKLLANHPRSAPLRVWVPGCSTGEEVYSLAICILEYLGDVGPSDLPVKIFGTDVSASAISTARAARYPEAIERDVSAGRLSRFFVKLGGAYQIAGPVRDLCVFARQDTTRDPPFSKIDLISCRNLMIYLGTRLQDRVLPIFHYALNEPGFLLLGMSETVRSYVGFVTFDAKHKIYARTSALPRFALDFVDTHRISSMETDGLPPGKTASSRDVHREADRLVLAEFGPPGVVVTDDLAIVQFRGQTGAYLEPSPGAASLDLLRMAREELRLALRQTIDEARARDRPVRRRAAVATGAARRPIELEVIPFSAAASSQHFFVVLFKEERAVEGASGTVAPGPLLEPSEKQAQEEAASTRAYLQSVIEQVEASNEELKAANEEIVSSNEELRSTTEELQTAKEELQATNEELRTVNDELQERNVEASRLNDDLINVLSSVNIPIVLLGRDSRIRRFTPAATSVFRLVGNDVGRPISDIRQTVHIPDLARMIAEVLESLTPATCKTDSDDGRWYQVTVRPYLTLDNRIDGVVLTAMDIDALTKAAELLSDAKEYAESILDTVRECLVVVDRELAIHSANRAFLSTFGLRSGEAEGQRLIDVARGVLNVPALRTLLAQAGDGERVEDVPIECDLATLGRRTFRINARRVDRTSLLLLALEDFTERDRAAVAIGAYETRLGRPVLYDLGLPAALSWLAEDMQKRHGIRVELACEELGKKLDEPTAALLFRGVRELLMNVIKHAHVGAAKVSLAQEGGEVVVVVEDAGAGFDATRTGFGLSSLRDQVTSLGGSIDVESSPGHGARVRLRVPLAS